MYSVTEGPWISMLVRYSDWKKPTDAAFAFPLREVCPAIPPLNATTDIESVAREVFGDETAERFERVVHRWDGPETPGPEGESPFIARQLLFEETPWRRRLDRTDLETVLRGRSLVLRDPSGAVDFILRDHHMIDVALYHYRTTGQLPQALFHADRHSDYCRDSFLERQRPDQAATWWKLFEGLKRPGDGSPVLAEDRVFFANARAPHEPWMSGRAFEEKLVIPWFLQPAALHWSETLAREGVTSADWVSLDLDYFQPSPQFALVRGLLRDTRFLDLLRKARVRVFVLSPQFTNGGDRYETWQVNGRMSSSLRLINLLRGMACQAVSIS